MRNLLIVGIVLLGLGAVVFFRGASFTSKEDVLKVGDIKVTASEKKTIPAWAGGAAMAVGAVMILAGATSKKRG